MLPSRLSTQSSSAVPPAFRLPTDDPQQIYDNFGPYFGAAASAEKVEQLVGSMVARHHLSDLAEVSQLRWWDYRRLTPAHAFLLFVSEHTKAYDTFARLSLSTRGKHGLVWDNSNRKTQHIFQRDRRHVVGLWKAMMVADAYCMPYGAFLNLIFRRAHDCNWERVPQPTQLYSIDMMAAVVESWEERKRERLYSAKHPVFQLANYCGLKIQDGYRDWLVDMLQAVREPIQKLSVVLYERPQLPLDIARQHWSEQIIDRARLASA